MNLNKYIKKNYKNPNPKVLEALGASKALIDYLRFTPWNTNVNIINSLVDGGGGGGDESSAVVGTAIVGKVVI